MLQVQTETFVRNLLNLPSSITGWWKKTLPMIATPTTLEAHSGLPTLKYTSVGAFLIQCINQLLRTVLKNKKPIFGSIVGKGYIQLLILVMQNDVFFVGIAFFIMSLFAS